MMMRDHIMHLVDEYYHLHRMFWEKGEQMPEKARENMKIILELIADTIYSLLVYEKMEGR